jgi:DNA modification methylase
VSTTTKTAFYSDDTECWQLLEADALLALAKLPDACVDAIVTDPPYGIDFAGEAWDGVDIRRSSDDGLGAAGAFERWTMVWAREARRVLKPGGHLVSFGAPRTFHRLVCGAEDSGLEVRDQLLWLYHQGLPKSRRLADGLATTLKPAYEPILLARSPLVGSTPSNLQEWGTGALNTEATRANGYWPAHVVASHAERCAGTTCLPDCPVGMLEAQRQNLSRMFFCAKATKQEREAGCEQLPEQSVQLYNGGHNPARVRRNTHRTVKPIALMRWLVALVTPPDGVVLDPFTGSGSTGAAALLEGRQFVGIEREPEYIDIACARLTHWAHQARDGS